MSREKKVQVSTLDFEYITFSISTINFIKSDSNTNFCSQVIWMPLYIIQTS